jgi:pimeloyl-ACP methyl ester carboxylesterase
MTRRRTFMLLWLPLLLLLAIPLSAAAQDDAFDSAGVPIHYLDTGGDGEPVMLVHSFSSSSDMWTRAGFGPSDDFRFVALDVRGHGQSGKPEDPDAYGAEMVEDIVRLMDHLEIDAAHVAGYSMGAEIALKLVTEHPDRVRSLVAGGSGWSPAEAFEVYEFAAMGFADSPTLADSMRAMTPPEVTDEQFAFMLDAFEQHGIDTANADTGALGSVARSMIEIIDLPEEDVAAIDVPVLGIVSENDPERPNLERMEGVVPDFELVLIPAGPTGDGNLDHLGATLDPLFRDTIVEFLSEHA